MHVSIKTVLTYIGLCIIESVLNHPPSLPGLTPSVSTFWGLWRVPSIVVQQITALP